jgi:HEAT repeat protein
MEPFFRSLDLDQLSFWIGFLSGFLFYALALRTWPIIKQVGVLAFKKLADLRDSLTSGSGERLRQDIYRYVQRQHLTSMLCALDEILIKPRVQLPPLVISPGEEVPYEPASSRILPYLPDFPEFNAVFQTPSLDLADLVRYARNLVLIGPPGTGKTVALASLASRIARRDPDISHLAEKLPIFVQISDLLGLFTEDKSLFSLLYDTTARYASALTQPRLAEVLRLSLKQGTLLLLIDGMDELPPEQVKRSVSLISDLGETYPDLLIVAAASPQNYSVLPGIGFIPIAIAGWTSHEKMAYLEKCSVLWRELALAHPEQPVSSVPPAMLLNWISNPSLLESPLEFTLRVWAAFAGDPIGPTANEAIEAYTWRMLTGMPNGILAIQRIAQYMVLNSLAAIPKGLANELVSEYETVALQQPVQEQDQDGEIRPMPEPTRTVPTRQLISNFINNGILIERSGDHLAFSHSILLGYLAAAGLVEQENITILFQQPAWSLRAITIGFLNLQHDLSDHIIRELENIDEPVQREKIEVGRWLAQAQPTSDWVIKYFRRCVNDLQDNYLPLGLRFRIIGVMASSKENTMGSLFRRMLSHQSPHVRMLAAIGLGLIRESKSSSELAQMTSDPDLSVRIAACLALGAINTGTSKDALADALLHSDEAVQICAAETLANDPHEGFDTLREASEFDDLLVRKAATYGLAKITEDWAFQKLQQMQLEDSQWVVRNAAEQALERLSHPRSAIPDPYPPLMNTPWLIQYAGQSGEGISSNEAGLELLVKAARDGSPEQKIAAYNRLAALPHIDENGLEPLYREVNGTDEELREIAYNVLWHLSGRGKKIRQPLHLEFD